MSRQTWDELIDTGQVQIVFCIERCAGFIQHS